MYDLASSCDKPVQTTFSIIRAIFHRVVGIVVLLAIFFINTWVHQTMSTYTFNYYIINVKGEIWKKHGWTKTYVTTINWSWNF